MCSPVYSLSGSGSGSNAHRRPDHPCGVRMDDGSAALVTDSSIVQKRTMDGWRSRPSTPIAER